jgi:chemosensory pili system protein ChpA (sensor histidine kinase/response regulator)
MHNPADHVVLIADDDPDLRMLVSHTLNRVGYTVIEACDGVEALELIREHSPGVALLDVNMPRLDGVEVAERLRADEAGTPFIFVTALTGRENLDRAVATFPAGYISKPFPLQKLRDQVRAVLTSA